MKNSGFLKEELLDATKNYTYGLAEEGVVVSETKEKASFKIVLLEKVELLIELSTCGFTIMDMSSVGDEANSYCEEKKKLYLEKTFETMDALLLSLSPAFAHKQSEELFRKLSV